MKEIRQKRLMDLEGFVRAKQVVSLEDVARAFDVSMNTIRRDVTALIASGAVVKVHGGVMIADSDSEKSASQAGIAHYPSRAQCNIPQKELIGHLAAELVQDGDTIFIDSGTTTAELVNDGLLEKDVVVVSNSLPVFKRLENARKIRLLALGGVYIPDARAFSGAQAIQELERVSLSKAFLGASAVSASFGVSNNLSYEIDLKRSASERAGQVILLADAKKLNKDAAMQICPLSRLQALVTDQAPTGELAETLKTLGVQIYF